MSGLENWAAVDFGVEDEVDLSLVLEHCAIGAKQYATAQGFYDKPFNFGERIALITSELSEALEADRHGNPPSEHCPELTGVEEELADVFVRLVDLCGYLDIDLGRAVRIKQAFNLTRPPRHAKAY